MRYFMGILIFAVLSYPASILGQPTLSVRWGFGMTQIGGDSYFSTPRKSVRTGASIDIPIRDRFSLQFGGDHMQKGARDYSLYGDNSKLYIDYIEFSGLGVVWLLSPRRTPSLFLLAGPTVAFKVGVEGKDLFARRYGGGSFQFKTLDFGIAGGIGTQMAISTEMIVRVELLYTLGIQSINKTIFHVFSYYTLKPEKRGMMNHALSFCVSLGFPYGKRTGG